MTKRVAPGAFPMPGDTLPGDWTVIASVWYRDEDPEIATIIILLPQSKVTLNGLPYCGTHLKRAEELARSKAAQARREDYVEDPVARAIVDADRLLRASRR